MGLNYNYLLYFKRAHLWDALQGVVKIAEHYDPPPITIHFPDHDLLLPIATEFLEENELPHDKPRFNFALSLLFEEDEAILDYLVNNGNEGTHRAPPDVDGVERVAIGFIYLTVYSDISKHFAFTKPTDLVLFKFGTTGIRMSLLFSESISIRKTFTTILERYHGMCGIFDREIDGGELFWLHGQQLSEDIWDIYMPPDEIEEMLNRGWLGGDAHGW
jgi:hypothetical protein